MQAKAADDLRRMVTDKLVAEGLVYEGAKAFATPRRLALTVHGIPARQPDLKEERSGPRVGAPRPRSRDFSRRPGLPRSARPRSRRDPKKGDFYVALIEKPGRAALDVLAEILPGDRRAPFRGRSRCAGARARPKPGALDLGAAAACDRRDLRAGDRRAGHRCTFAVDGIAAGRRDVRPPLHGAGRDSRCAASTTTWPSSTSAKVVLDPRAPQGRRSSPTPRTSPSRKGYELVEDAGAAGRGRRAGRVAGGADGLVRRDVLVDPRRGDPRHHPQQPEMLCGARSRRQGKLANKFILVANIEASDGGKAIVAGNERVIRARLSDAKFFYETDLKTKLEDRLPKFEQHRVPREARHAGASASSGIERLASGDSRRWSAPMSEKAKRARASGARADLLTEVVGEFPELQGPDGKILRAGAGREHASVAARERGALQAAGAGGSCADRSGECCRSRLRTRLTRWLASGRSTRSRPRSKGPTFALRRAALGVIRLIV